MLLANKMLSLRLTQTPQGSGGPHVANDLSFHEDVALSCPGLLRSRPAP